MSFQERCTDAARAFVRTVVVFDDFQRGEPVIPRRKPAGKLEPPRGAARPLAGEAVPVVPVPSAEDAAGDPVRRVEERGGEPEDKGHTPDEESAVPPTADLTEDAAHGLDGNVLQRAFAEKRVICSVLFEQKPEEQDQPAFIERVHGVASRADVLVLDWSWHGDRGLLCEKLIDRLRERDRSVRRQLVLIYTAEDDEFAFRERLGKLQGVVSEDKYHFAWPEGGLYVQVLQKPRSKGNEFYAGSRVSEREFPDKVFEIFGQHYGGLLANAAMHGLGHLRESTHGVLRRFRGELDAPYVVHRAYTVPRGGAEEQVRDLLADSLTDVLGAWDVGQHVDGEAVELWLREQTGHVERLGKTDLKFPNDDAMGWLATPCEELDTLSNKQKKKLQSADALHKITSALFGDPEETRRMTNDFSVFIYTAEDPPAHAPCLANGTIVEKDDETLLLCVMPLCDAERVVGERGFPFLRMQPGNRKGKKNFVLARGGVAEPWHVDPKMDQLRVVVFEGQEPPGPVRATDGSGAMVFTDKEGTKHRYLARLRPLVTHDITQALGASGARIGLTSSEFVRRGT